MDSELKTRLKEILIEALNLDDISVDEIQDEEPLIGGGLDLDSIDALELVVAIEKEYGIKIANSEESKKAFASMNALTAFVKEQMQ